MLTSFKLRVSRVISSLHSCRSIGQTSNPTPYLRRLPPINIATLFNGDDPTEKTLLYKRRDVESTDYGCCFHSDEISHTETSCSSLEYTWQLEEKWHVISKFSDQTHRRKIDKSSVFDYSDDEQSSLLKLSPPMKTKSRLRISASSLDTVFCFSSSDFSLPAPESSSISPSPARLSILKPLLSYSVEGKVRESYAVVKISEDPYEDFRRSMMEMILEKQIYEQKDLAQLLDCFVCLNSQIHHSTIFQAFSDIWDALFFTDSFRNFVP